MLIKNGIVFTPESKFEKLDVAFSEGKITKLAPCGSLPGEAVDAEGQYVLPGFVDVHSHGCMNSDICDASAKGIEKMLKFYGEEGVTTVLPATMSYSEKILSSIISTALPYFDRTDRGAVIRGINMEGPFVNIEKKGAQNGEYIVSPSLRMFENLYRLSHEHIRIVDIAPELEGSIDFIRKVSGRCAVSLAHTNANYVQSMAAFDAGASHVTHLFNAMPPFKHRDPGVIGAASDAGAFVELITDGYHLHPSVVRAVFRWFGSDKICLISDSMRACGMPNGEYDLGGQTVYMRDGKATLVDGTIAGSVISLAEACRRAISFGIPMEDAVLSATLTPARSAKLDGIVGSLTPGKNADIVIWDKAYKTKKVFVNGRPIA